MAAEDLFDPTFIDAKLLNKVLNFFLIVLVMPLYYTHYMPMPYNSDHWSTSLVFGISQQFIPILIQYLDFKLTAKGYVFDLEDSEVNDLNVLMYNFSIVKSNSNIWRETFEWLQ